MQKLNFGFGALAHFEEITGTKFSDAAIALSGNNTPSFKLLRDLYIAGRFDFDDTLTARTGGEEIDKIITDEGMEVFVKGLRTAIEESPILGAKKKSKR